MATKQAIPLPKVSLPRLPGIPEEPRGWGRTEVHVRPRGFEGAERFAPRTPAGEPPAWWKARYPTGTEPEWAIYWGLIQNGLKPDVDFFYQVVVPGVGSIYYSNLDFFVPDRRIGIEVQGIFWHYVLGSERQQRDITRAALFAREGIQVIYIDSDDAIANPVFYAREAIQGRDHSKLKRGF